MKKLGFELNGLDQSCDNGANRKGVTKSAKNRILEERKELWDNLVENDASSFLQKQKTFSFPIVKEPYTFFSLAL